jgi:DNA-binding response OmpR family regulator
MKICLVEDDLKLGSALHSGLANAGQKVTWLRSAAGARQIVGKEAFDALLLDLGLPDDSGMNLLREFRRTGITVPVVIITARDALDDRIEGLDAGADDFLIKPFATSELLARLRAVARRLAGGSLAGEPVWEVKDLVLNERMRTIARAGTRIDLSKTEFILMRTLMCQPDRVWTRRELEANAMPHVEGPVLDVHIHNLRKKLGGDYIDTVRGVGYVVHR